MPETDLNIDPSPRESLSSDSAIAQRCKKPWSLGDFAWAALDELTLPTTMNIEGKPVVSEVVVPEENVSFRYVLSEMSSIKMVPGVLPGKIELELWAPTGREIDTIVFTKLTPESLGRILDIALDYSARAPFEGLTAHVDPILPPGKLQDLLETAGKLGVAFETKLGALPADIAQQYSQRMTQPPEEEAPQERFLRQGDRMLTYSMIAVGMELAKRNRVKQVLVHADSPSTVAEINRARGKLGVIWIVGSDSIAASSSHSGDMVYVARNSELGKDSQVRLALFSALLQGHVGLGERVLTFSGPDKSKHLDRIAFAVPGREFSWLDASSLEELKAFANKQVLERIINVALRLGSEGLEGKYFGATFVIGELKELEPHLKQGLLNPFKGHPAERRSVLDKNFLETLRAFAAIDGAVVLSPEGIAERACVLLDVQTGSIEAQEGWGARHVSAASLTAVSNALAVVISQTSGMVTLMWDGKPLLELESR